MPSTPGRALRKMRHNNTVKSRAFTGLCPIRQHTGDGAYVGRCDHFTYDWVCPLHGRMSDYPDDDDRAIDPRHRDFTPGQEREGDDV